MNIEEAYKILGLDLGAGEEEINSQYKKLAKVHHPDAGGKNSKMSEINSAKDKALDYAKNKDIFALTIMQVKDIIISDRKSQEKREQFKSEAQVFYNKLERKKGTYKSVKQISTITGILLAIITLIYANVLPFYKQMIEQDSLLSTPNSQQQIQKDSLKLLTSDSLKSLSVAIQQKGQEEFKLRKQIQKEEFDSLAKNVLISIVLITCIFLFISYLETKMKEEIEDFKNDLENKRTVAKLLFNILLSNGKQKEIKIDRNFSEYFFREAVGNWIEANRFGNYNSKLKGIYLSETGYTISKIAKQIGEKEFSQLVLLKAQEKELIEELVMDIVPEKTIYCMSDEFEKINNDYKNKKII